MKVKFKNIDSERIKKAFLEVLEKYEPLHEFTITLVQKPIKSSTMQAQPIFNYQSVARGVKSYKIKLAIYVRDSQNIRVDEIPKNVLVGWFAHELGHLIDYAPYSNWKMIQYGIKYILSDSFKRQTEHEADIIAVRHGFKDQIIAAKEFILNTDLLAQKYKDKINKYYMSIDDVLLCAEDKSIIKPTSDL